MNAVVLLFVNELDERLYQLAHACNLQWVEDVHNSMRMSRNTEARNLILTTSINQARTYIRKASKMTSNSKSPTEKKVVKMDEPEHGCEFLEENTSERKIGFISLRNLDSDSVVSE